MEKGAVSDDGGGSADDLPWCLAWFVDFVLACSITATHLLV